MPEITRLLINLLSPGGATTSFERRTGLLVALKPSTG